MRAYITMAQGIELDAQAVRRTSRRSTSASRRRQSVPEAHHFGSGRHDGRVVFRKERLADGGDLQQEPEEHHRQPGLQPGPSPDNDGKPVTFVLNGPVNGAKGYARGMEL